MLYKVRLKFHSIGEIVGSEELGIITLVDEPRERMITIVCDKAMAVQLELRAKHVPITQIMLPEVLASVLKNQAGIQMEILIKDLVEGQYRALLCNRISLDTLPLRAADAVLLSLAADIPLYIETRLMQRQSVRFAEGTGGIAIPVNTLSTDMLEEALKKAIAQENYELASQLRDEKKKRGTLNSESL